jgi:hypothetical protein
VDRLKRGELNEAEEEGGRFVAAPGDTPVSLDATKKVFDPVSRR